MLALLLASAALAPIAWSTSLPEALERAGREERLVLLDVEAVWCHWCHVMDRTTYRDRRVVRLVGEKFVAVKADQDAQPAIAARYQRWGWPATVVLTADGRELAKLRGYQEPADFARLLEKLARERKPLAAADEALPADGGAALLTEPQREELLRRHAASYDPRYGGFGRRHKLVYAEPIELDLALARAGDAEAEGRAKKTLDAALALLDPAWGGFYQYSDKLDWSGPHFEKLLTVQADAIRVYALAARVFDNVDYRSAARATGKYLIDFLGDAGGGFHGSQDADLSAKVDGHRYFKLPDARRRALGLPRVDPHLYAGDAGQAAEALVALHDATGDAGLLERAEAAVRWAMRERAVAGGGFHHGADAGEGLALLDTLAMGRAFLALHAATANPEWLPRAGAAARFLQAHFCSGAHAGCAAAEVSPGAAGVFARPVLDVLENASVTRFANLLFRYTGDLQDKTLAEKAGRFLAAAPTIADGGPQPGTLLADRELRAEPVHVTVVGAAGDEAASALFAAARRLPTAYARTDRWDGQGPLPANTATRYPPTDGAAAYVCGPRFCSAPVIDPSLLAAAVEKVTRRRP